MIKDQLKILLVQNNKYQSLLLEREISSCFENSIVAIARTKNELQNKLGINYFDILIIDWEKSDVEDYSFIKNLKEQEPESSIIVLTKDSSENNARYLDRMGADIALIKDESSYVAIPRLIKEIIGQKLIDRTKSGHDSKIRNDQSDMINVAAGTLLHEINNPLMTILGLSELILEDSFRIDRQTAKKIRIIQKSAQRIEKTLKKLRKISSPFVRNTVSGKLIDPDLTRDFVEK